MFAVRRFNKTRWLAIFVETHLSKRWSGSCVCNRGFRKQCVAFQLHLKIFNCSMSGSMLRYCIVLLVHVAACFFIYLYAPCKFLAQFTPLALLSRYGYHVFVTTPSGLCLLVG